MIALPTDLLVRVGGGIALLAALWLHGCHHGRSSERDAHESTKAEHAAVIARLADLTRVAAEKARAATAAVSIERADLDAAYTEELTNAKLEADRLRADLRSGRRELQDWWACPVSGSAARDAAADGDETDVARRADSAARIDQAVRADASAIDHLWKAWEADRRAVIAAGCAVEGER